MPLLPNKANTEGNNESLEDRTPVPADEYIVHMVKSEFKPTKAKTGHYLNCQFKILEGPYKGKTLFAILNLDNPNPVAVEIANKELNSICKACDKQGVENSEELHNIPMKATVKVTEGDANYPPSNNITGYAPLNESGESVAPQGSSIPESANVPEAAEATKGKSKLPWE